jgi:hypothetical protein
MEHLDADTSFDDDDDQVLVDRLDYSLNRSHVLNYEEVPIDLPTELVVSAMNDRAERSLAYLESKYERKLSDQHRGFKDTERSMIYEKTKLKEAVDREKFVNSTLLGECCMHIYIYIYE